MRQFLYALLQNLSKVPVIVLGWFIVPFMWFLRGRHVDNMPALLIPWTNPEDWTGGYRDFPAEYNCIPPNLYEGKRGFWQFYKYHAFRNGGDGLRNYEWHLCRYEQHRMVIKYLKHGTYVEQGKYGSWQLQFNRLHIKFGFRMTPIDAIKGYQVNSIRWNYGASAAWSARWV